MKLLVILGIRMRKLFLMLCLVSCSFAGNLKEMKPVKTCEENIPMTPVAYYDRYSKLGYIQWKKDIYNDRPCINKKYLVKMSMQFGFFKAAGWSRKDRAEAREIVEYLTKNNKL